MCYMCTMEYCSKIKEETLSFAGCEPEETVLHEKKRPEVKVN